MLISHKVSWLHQVTQYVNNLKMHNRLIELKGRRGFCMNTHLTLVTETSPEFLWQCCSDFIWCDSRF